MSTVEAFKARGDDTRLQMMLGRHRVTLCTYEIEARFGLAQPTISHHLRSLREVGLIDGERRGNRIYMKLVHDKKLRIARLVIISRTYSDLDFEKG